MNEWTRCRPWIEAALAYADGTHTIEDIEQGIGEGKFQFWAGQRAAIITEIITFPRLKAVNFFLVGGDLKELRMMEPGITEWMRTEHGCSRAMGVGRGGFERVLAPRGYTKRWAYIVKELA